MLEHTDTQKPNSVQSIEFSGEIFKIDYNVVFSSQKPIYRWKIWERKSARDREREREIDRGRKWSFLVVGIISFMEACVFHIYGRMAVKAGIRDTKNWKRGCTHQYTQTHMKMCCRNNEAFRLNENYLSNAPGIRDGLKQERNKNAIVIDNKRMIIVELHLKGTWYNTRKRVQANKEISFSVLVWVVFFCCSFHTPNEGEWYTYTTILLCSAYGFSFSIIPFALFVRMFLVFFQFQLLEKRTHFDVASDRKCNKFDWYNDPLNDRGIVLETNEMIISFWCIPV